MRGRVWFSLPTLAAMIIIAVILSTPVSSQPGESSGKGGGDLPVITAVPRTMSFQGYLADSDGNPINDTLSIEFLIYDTESGGSSLWDETLSVPLTEGNFSAELGLTNPIDLSFDTQYYIELVVESETLDPRLRLNMVPYSASTDTSDYSSSVEWSNINGIPPGFADGTDDGADSVMFADSSNYAYSSGISGFADSTDAITDGAVDFADIGQNGAAADQVMKWNGSAWVAADDETGGGGGGWTDDGNAVRLETSSDSVGIGTATPTEKLDVEGNIRVSGKSTIGIGNINTGVYSFVAGRENIAEDTSSTVGGGRKNYARGNYSVIAGGGGPNDADSNSAVGPWAAIGGGRTNSSVGYASTISGGFVNNALSTGSVISGGYGNAANQLYTSIGGGLMNTADGYYSTIGGGRSNTASGDSSATVGGGSSNNASGSGSTISGGGSNSASQYFATVGGGMYNGASGMQSTVGGGVFNSSSGLRSTVGGGCYNYATGQNSVIAGGGSDQYMYRNTASGVYSAIGGGLSNTASTYNTTVSGGNGNTASGGSAAVSGGSSNTASGDYSSVGGGLSNSATERGSFVGGGAYNFNEGYYSTIAGGLLDTITATADYSYLFGIRSKLTADSTFMVDMPHVRFGNETTGFEIPNMDGSNGQVMITNGSGLLSWANMSSTWNWTDSSSFGPDSVQYAANSGIANYSDSTGAITDGAVDFLDIGQNGAAINQIMKWNGSAWVASDDDTGAEVWNWSDSSSHGPDSVLYSDTSAYAYAVGPINYADSTGAITDGAVDFSDIGQNGATSNQVIKWNGSTWVAGNDETGVASGWVDDGTAVRLETTSDNVGIGTSSPTEKLEVSGNILVNGKATFGLSNSNTGYYSYVTGVSNTASGNYSVVSGGQNCGATSAHATMGGGRENLASALYSTVSGGWGDTTSGQFATVCGGQLNRAIGNNTAIGGGFYNVADGQLTTIAGGNHNSTSGNYSTVGGGQINTASFDDATVSGGSYNTASGAHSTVCGGTFNTASGHWSAILGGQDNIAKGMRSSVVAGFRARANHDGSIVLAANSSTLSSDSVSTGGNEQMLFRADGGIYITNTSETAPYDNTNIITTRGGAYLSGNGGTWTNSSDRNKKENFEPVDKAELLGKISSLPISKWNYKTDDENIKHIGPMAQDFNEIFDVGADSTSISTIDPSGVALAGIQALLERIEQLEARVAELEAERKSNESR